MKVINIIFNWFSTPLKPKNTEIAPNIDKPSWILANMLAEKLLTKELDITVSESSVVTKFTSGVFDHWYVMRCALAMGKAMQERKP